MSAPTGGWSRSCTPTTRTRPSRGCASCSTTSCAASWSPTFRECVLLSGGLDSSAVTALSARELERRAGAHVRRRLRRPGGELQSQMTMRPTLDTPYVHDVAEHVGSEHTDIVLDHDQLADLDVRRKVVGARDLPMGIGDMDASLYLLFKAIREHSTVALSGESADEIFGGYRQFHDPAAQQPDAFPWLAIVAAPSADDARCPRRRRCAARWTSTATCRPLRRRGGRGRARWTGKTTSTTGCG